MHLTVQVPTLIKVERKKKNSYKCLKERKTRAMLNSDKYYRFLKIILKETKMLKEERELELSQLGKEFTFYIR